MFGSHLSIAGGMVNALEEAERLGFDCVQVFTKNQRQWRVRPMPGNEREAWWEKLRALKWDRARGPARTVSHNSYLINLASPDRESWDRSVRLQRVELERCEDLGIPLCVAHPGAHLGAAPPAGQAHDLDRDPSRDERAGLKRIVKALDRLHRELPGYRTITCMETTTGSGSNLGYAFHHLAFVREAVREPDRVGFCFDTCHVTAAGYDMSTDAGAARVLRRFATVCGSRNLRVFHLNDSEGEIGSRRDRHAHIGKGTCGLSCFRAIVNHGRYRRVPKILETPKEDDERGVPWDLVNVRRLKGLIRPPGSDR